jgi:hypothetical protein
MARPPKPPTIGVAFIKIFSQSINSQQQQNYLHSTLERFGGFALCNLML